MPALATPGADLLLSWPRSPKIWQAPSATQIASMVSAVHGRLQSLHGEGGSALPGQPNQPLLSAQAQAGARKREIEGAGGPIAGLPPLPKKSRFSQA
jgi:hypothetical protein